MKYGVKAKVYGWFYHNACKCEIQRSYKEKKIYVKKIKLEYISIMRRAKDIGQSPLFSVYCMAAYFIALNNIILLKPEENYQILKNGLYASKLFHLAVGKGNSYLNPRKMKKRKRWERQSHLKKYENDWIVDVLEKTEKFELGYNFHQCGICKLCADEKCFELAKYLCQLDFVMADMMGIELKRTQTIAEGAKYCDFRYSKKQFSNLRKG